MTAYCAAVPRESSGRASEYWLQTAMELRISRFQTYSFLIQADMSVKAWSKGIRLTVVEANNSK